MSATDEQIQQALEALRNGELIVFPTETLYGIGCDALNPEAVARLCEAKKRPAGKPLAVILGETSMADQLTSDLSPAATRLAESYWPGPLTLVLPARENLPEAIVGDQTIGLRVSSDPVAARLSRELGRPICAPSANPTGLPPAPGARGARVTALLFARGGGVVERALGALGDVAVVEQVAQPLDEPARGGDDAVHL